MYKYIFISIISYLFIYNISCYPIHLFKYFNTIQSISISKFPHFLTNSNDNSIDNSNNLIRKTKTKPKTKKQIIKTIEFSRIVNSGQISSKRNVLCKLAANEEERLNLAKRFDIANILHFHANITLSRQDIQSIVITGTLSAEIYNGDLFPTDIITSEFETIMLDNTNVPIEQRILIEDAQDYDDEVGINGEIDIGEIASQYLSMEIY